MTIPVYIIGGAPRSRTTFLMRSLLVHPAVKGSADAHEYTTNESPTLMHDAIRMKDYSGLKRLLDFWCKEPGTALVVKAPGYVLARPFFDACPLDINPIYLATVRPLDELVVSNVAYPDGLAHLRRTLPKTDCPVEAQDTFSAAWGVLDDYGRAVLRCLWHTDALQDYAGLEIASSDYRRAAALAKKLCALAGLDMDPILAAALKGFKAYEPDSVELEKAQAAISDVNAMLGR